jgi:hypothetical protein
MRLKKYFCFFLISTSLLSLLSCKKSSDNEIIIQGNIVDANQHIPLANAVVTLWASRIQGGIFNPNYVTVAFAITDANGYYNIKTAKDMDAGYRITVDKANYYSQTTDFSITALAPGTHQLYFGIYPEAYFKLIVKNTTPFNNNDFISYWFFSAQPAGINCCNNNIVSFTGQSYENTIKCRTFGGQNMVVKWNVKKNNIVTPSETSVYCTPFDTTTYNLNY